MIVTVSRLVRADERVDVRVVGRGSSLISGASRWLEAGAASGRGAECAGRAHEGDARRGDPDERSCVC